VDHMARSRTAAPTRLVSNSAADRAGDLFRQWLDEPVAHPDQLDADRRSRYIAAIVTIDDYRAMHAVPMASVTMGIRSMVRTVRGNDEIRPGQRFKRINRILNKLVRFPRMRLSQMEDIGGCRVVLATIDEVYAVVARVRHNWPDNARISDYIAEPKPDGYRGIHIVHKRGGRLIEVQLRTEGQHDWAEAIETSSPRVGFNLKDGEGTDDLKEYFKMAAERIAREEAGLPPDVAFEAAFAELRDRVSPYFQRHP
jgi:putative GTP pyrophosphokinase